MKSKDIIGHECNFLDIDRFLYDQFFCQKVWVLSRVSVAVLKISKLVIEL
jgi:hypothetical protein